jgi:hypothetical protein
MITATQRVVEVEFVLLPPSEIEERGSRLRVLILRGALRHLAQQSVSPTGDVECDADDVEISVPVGHEDQ